MAKESLSLAEFMDWAKSQEDYQALSVEEIFQLADQFPNVVPTSHELTTLIHSLYPSKPAVEFSPVINEETEDEIEKAILATLYHHGVFNGNPAKNTSTYELNDELVSIFKYSYENLYSTNLTTVDLEALPEGSYIYNIWSENFVQLFVKTRFSDIPGHRELRWYNVQSDITNTDPYTSVELGRPRVGETAFTLLLLGRD